MERVKLTDRYKLPARASFYYIMSTVVGKAAGVLVTPIFTRIMDTTEFGAYSYYISVLVVVSLISSFFLSPTVIYSGLGKFKGEKRTFENSAVLLTSLISMAICIVLFTFNGVFGIKRSFAIYLFLQIIFDSVVTAELLAGKFSYDYTKVVTINLLSSFLSPILSLFLIFRFEMGAEGRIFGLLIASGILAITMFIRRAKEGMRPSKVHALYLLKNSTPLIPSIIARATMGWSDKLVVKSYLGIEELAKYSVAHTVGMALFGLIGGLSSAMNPWMIRKLSSGKRTEIFPVVKKISELISFGAAIIIGLAPELFSFLAPASYFSALPVIIPFAISTLPYFLFSVASVLLTYSEKTKLVSLSAALGAIFNLSLNILLISALGTVGGALSYLISEIAVYLISLRLMGKIDTSIKEAMKQSFPFIFVFSMAPVFFILYDSLALRLLLLIIPATLAVNRGFSCLELVREKNT